MSMEWVLNPQSALSACLNLLLMLGGMGGLPGGDRTHAHSIVQIWSVHSPTLVTEQSRKFFNLIFVKLLYYVFYIYI